MEVIEGELKWHGRVLDPSLKKLRLVCISDVHYGNPLCSVKHFMKAIGFILDNPDVYVILNGDLCESAIKTSKGDIFKQVGSPQDQRDQIIEWLYPIRDRILGATTGNHEQRIYNDTGIDISCDIAKALGTQYRPEGILVKIMFGSNCGRHPDRYWTYWSYATHGYGGARTKSAKAVKVERVATWIHADVYWMSHDHVVNVAPDVYLLPNAKGVLDKETGWVSGVITAHRKMLIKSNAFLKWGGYSEAGGFPPVDLEPAIVTLSGEGYHRVKVEV